MTGDPAPLSTQRAQRLAALTAVDGWLNLTDRIVITPGKMLVGAAHTADIRLSTGPDILGTLTFAGDGQATLLAPGWSSEQEFQPVKDAPPRLIVPPFLLELHSVDTETALRVRLIDDPRRLNFAGLGYFPTRPHWLIRAAWVPLDQPTSVPVEMVSGAQVALTQTHVARFVWQGVAVGLVSAHQKDGQPMFVFRDATSGHQTYAASRFLNGRVDGDQIILDFNLAYNPPCAFTEFAICPLPPRENILPFPVLAGELAP